MNPFTIFTAKLLWSPVPVPVWAWPPQKVLQRQVLPLCWPISTRRRCIKRAKH